ncbi:hypothetical protein [Streptomyces althioticus]|uniref:hypothetical protein n=1 Tax=Streptomyces althioticus TaxID=83380 RepID=UPI0036991A3F
MHVARRDGEDLCLTTARHDQQREETADITARLLGALVRSDAGERAILPEWRATARVLADPDHGEVTAP